MWKFCSLFSSIAVAWCIMNSFHKVVHWVKNTTWKLCADCAKRRGLWKNQSWILHHDIAPDLTSLLVREFLENHASTTVFTELGPRWLFLFPKLKTPMKRKSFATISTFLWRLLFKSLLSKAIHNWSLQHFSQDYHLASYATYVMCINFIHEWVDQ